MGFLMSQISFFEINLTYKDLTQILENLYSIIEKTNNNKIKSIYRILNKSKDAMSLSSSSLPKNSTKIKLRHDQWVKIIENCQSNEQIIEYLEGRINILKKYQRNSIY